MASKIQQIVVTNDTPGNDEFGLVVRPIGGTGGGDVTIVDPIGQKPMDESVSVVIASDQTPIPVTVSGSSGDGSILDGVDSAIKATVFDRTNSNPLATELVDTNGDPLGTVGNPLGVTFSGGGGNTASGTLTANGSTLDLDCTGLGSASITITAIAGGWDGHLDFSMSTDGINFQSAFLVGQNDNGTVGPYAPRSFMVENDHIIRLSVAGIKTFRITVSNRTVGTVTVVMASESPSFENLTTAVISGPTGNLLSISNFGSISTVPVDQSGNNLARDPGTSADRAVAVQGVSGGVPVAVTAASQIIETSHTFAGPANETFDVTVSGLGALTAYQATSAGGFNGTINISGSTDGITFFPLIYTRFDDGQPVSSLSTSVTSFEARINVAGVKVVRFLNSGWTVGSSLVKIFASVPSYFNHTVGIYDPSSGNHLLVNSSGQIQNDFQKIGGSAVEVNIGIATNGTQRVVLATDQPAVPVSATNLDIRDLAFATDKVDVSGSAVTVSGAVTTDGLTDAELRASPVEVTGSLSASTSADVFANDADAGYNLDADPATRTSENLTQDQYGNLRVVDYDTQMKMLVALEEIGQQLELTNDLLSRMVSFSGKNSLHTAAKQGPRLPRRRIN